MEKEISISVVAYKTDLNLLERLFGILLDTDLDIKIFVVDNSPTNAAEKICMGGKFAYIFNNKNIGYGAGHNIAINKIIKKSKYHLVINPDVFFEKGTLEKLYDFMERNPNAGLVMPKVVTCSGCVDYLCKLLPAPQNLFLRRFCPKGGVFKSLAEKINYIYELRFTGYDEIMEAPCLSGCFMFIRNAVFEKVGAFDERFFMYLEDFDLSRRIHKHYRTIYYPDAAIYHKNTKASYGEFNLLKHHIVSAIRYFNKWGWFFDKDRTRINKAALKKLCKTKEMICITK